MLVPQFRKAVLSHGVTLVAESHPYVRSVSVGVWVRVGSVNESPTLNGVSHFIEHLAFKGTKTRAPQQIATVLEGLGGDLNAFTEREVTCFHATVLNEHIDIALDVLSDLVVNPTFPKSEVERERKVLLQELSMVEESPEDSIYDSLFRQVWKGESLGQPIIGSRKTIQGLSRSMVERFFEDHYQPTNIVVAVAGGIEFEPLKERCEHYFRFNKPQQKLTLKRHPVRYHQRHWFQKNTSDQLHCLVGFEGVGVRDPKRYAYLLLSFVLGGGMGSRLFQEIREKAALAYSVDCDFLPFAETGIFTVYTGMSSRSLGKSLEILSAEFEKLRENDLPTEELDRVKGQLKGMILLSADQMEARQEALARNEILFGRAIPVEEVLASIDAVTQDDLRQAAKELFVPEKESLVVLSKNKPKLKKLSVFQ
ncbi:MAG: insulinase family protein [Proteobacteria bacterium]|nr:insulinase family protein [Pseudomonadota bacterium]